MFPEHIHIGTSGWSYPQWKPEFYLPGVKQGGWLTHYAAQFQTVELNTSFYHLPTEANILRWVERTPPHFLFAVKAWRELTHEKRLRECESDLLFFLKRVSLFGDKLGTVLFQLPPSLQRDDALLAGFLALLPPQPLCIMEFRHESWFDDTVYSLLRAHNVALCISAQAGSVSPLVVTADALYLRLHGTRPNYFGGYSDEELRRWAEWIARQRVRSVFAYFNNTRESVRAIQDALTLRAMLGHGGHVHEAPSKANELTSGGQA